MTAEEIKIRRLVNQHLVTPVGYGTVVRDLCGVQAQFLSNAIHSLKLRSGDFQAENPAGLVKSWTVRGTVHVFAQADLPLFLHEGREHFLRPRDTLEGDDCITRERKRYFAELIVAKIAEGTDTREGLKAQCFQKGLTEKEAESVFDAWGGTIRALCENGVIAHKVQEQKAYTLCPPFTPMEKEPAQLELVRRYFTHFGPATVKDAAYFFGTTQTRVKAWLEHLPVTAAAWDGRLYYFIETNQTYSETIPACLFLAGFDQLMLGYEKTESLFLPRERLRGIFSLTGIVMPPVLLSGRVVGRWKRKGKKISVTLFEPLCPADRQQVEDSAAALWPELGAVEFME